jgi:hypothetical protein
VKEEQRTERSQKILFVGVRLLLAFLVVDVLEATAHDIEGGGSFLDAVHWQEGDQSRLGTPSRLVLRDWLRRTA